MLDGRVPQGIRERRHLKNPGKLHHPEIGEVVLNKSVDKNRGKWKIGIVTDTIEATVWFALQSYAWAPRAQSAQCRISFH